MHILRLIALLLLAPGCCCPGNTHAKAPTTVPSAGSQPVPEPPTPHEVRIAVGQSHAEALATIEQHGGTDITPGLAIVGPNGEWPLHGFYWEFRDYDAVIELDARDGRIVALSFWTKDDFSEHGKSHRYAVERSITVLKLDAETRRVSVEDKKGGAE